MVLVIGAALQKKNAQNTTLLMSLQQGKRDRKVFPNYIVMTPRPNIRNKSTWVFG